MKTKYKVGDWVQLVSERPPEWNSDGDMDEFLGKEVRLTSIDNYQIHFEGQKRWWFNHDAIAGYAKHKLVQEIIKDL